MDSKKNVSSSSYKTTASNMTSSFKGIVPRQPNGVNQARENTKATTGSGRRRPRPTRKHKKKRSDDDEESARNKDKQSAARKVMNRLTQKPTREFTIATLEVEVLRPLIDLAYWSTFLEVRRDAAAAFATLAMNEANLEMLSQAGALGALLSLVGINNGKNDSQVHRDAATALSYLVKLDDVKLRLINAPDGLNSLFYMCRSPKYEVKQAAVKALANLASSDYCKEEIVKAGGIKQLFALTTCKDDNTKRRAAKVLLNMSTHPPIHDKLVTDPNAVSCTIVLLLDCPDIAVRRDMIEMTRNLASNNKRRLFVVNGGILGPILIHLDPTHSSLETMLLAFKCLQTLSVCPEVQRIMIRDGVLEAINKIIFVELKEFRDYRMNRQNMKLQKDKINKKIGMKASDSHNAASRRKMLTTPKTPDSKSTAKSRPLEKKQRNIEVFLEDTVLRYGLSIIVNLASHVCNRDNIIEKNIVGHLLSDPAIYDSKDKRVRRPVGKILDLLSDANGEPHDRHKVLFDQGILIPINTFLNRDDYELKVSASKIISNLSVSQVAKKAIGQDLKLLQNLVLLINPHNHDINEIVMKAIAEISEDRGNDEKLIQAGVIPATVSMISFRYKKKDSALEAVRALSNLSVNDSIKSVIVKLGALGYLIALSKSGTGLTKMYALATLTNLEHDTAATRIQMAARGYFARRLAEKMKKNRLIQQKKIELLERKISHQSLVEKKKSGKTNLDHHENKNKKK